MDFQSLPTEMLFAIFVFLKTRDLIRLSGVDVFFNSLVKNDWVWKGRVKHAAFLKTYQKKFGDHKTAMMFLSLPIIKGCSRIGLVNVKTLTLYKHKLTLLPTYFGNLTRLQTLYLGSNGLTKLPPTFTRLQALKELDLSHNPLGDAALSIIATLTNLKHLDMSRCGLKKLPSKLRCIKLESLEMRKNRIEDISVLGRITSLQTINFEHNKIATIPGNFSRLTSLITLSLEKNRISIFPRSILGLPLAYLDLDENNLVDLPFDIWRLSSLQMLGLRQNSLFTLPMCFGRLANLESTDLSFNHISSLPESFGCLGKLESLFLESNKHLTLPDSFTSLSSLTSLNMQGCPDVYPGILTAMPNLRKLICNYDYDYDDFSE